MDTAIMYGLNSDYGYKKFGDLSWGAVQQGTVTNINELTESIFVTTEQKNEATNKKELLATSYETDSQDSNAQEEVTNFQEQMASVQADLQAATSLVQNASSALQNATANVSSTATQLASAQSMPDTITDSSGKEVNNPDKAGALAQAQSAYKEALQKQAQAQADLADAQEEIQSTQEAYIQLQADLQDEKAVLEADKAEAEAKKQKMDTQEQELLDTISNFDDQLAKLNAQLEIARAEQATAEQNQKEEGFSDENGNSINIEKTGYQKDESIVGEDNKLVRNEDGTTSIINENGDVVLTANVTTVQQYNNYAEQIYNATAGRLGTDKKSFYEILNNEDLTGDDWVNIIQSYENNFGTSLINDVCADFNGITEKKACNEIMDKISSKLLESIESGNENAINITCNELYSALNNDYSRTGTFVENILNNSSNEAITQISKNYTSITGSDLIQDVNNNSNISTADSDLIVQRLNSIVTNGISATEELDLDNYSVEDKNKAWTINLLIQSLNNSINDFQNQNNEDGNVTDSFNTIKTLTGLGISSQDIATSLDEQENLINELTKALNGKSDKYSSFEEAYKDLTGVEYDEDKIIEYQQNMTNYSIAYSTIENAQNFQNSISKADNLQEVYDLYVNYYGDEEKGKEEFLSYIQDGMIPNENDYNDIEEKVIQFGGYVTSVEFNDNGQLVIQKATNYSYIREGEEYKYETIAYDLSDTTNMIKTLPRTFDNAKYVNQALGKVEEYFGDSLEELQEIYANSKQAALGNSDKLEETINGYCQSQDGFIDKLSSATQIAGMGTMAVGGIISFVNPPVGVGVMEAGKHMALGGMFGNEVLKTVDGLTSENGLSKEEVTDLIKEVASELGYMALGSGINSIAEGVQVSSLKALEAAGLSKNSAAVLSWLAEGGTDMSLSVLSDLIITGDLNLENNGVQVLLGILTGVSSAKVNSYKVSVQEEQLSKLLSGEITLDEVETTLKGAGFSDKEISNFKNGYSSGSLLKKIFGINSSDTEGKIDQSNIITTTTKPYDDGYSNNSRLTANVETRVPGGTVVEIGTSKLSLDNLNLVPGQSVTIGRDGDVKITGDNRVSRQHLQVTATENGYVIKDLNSTNGTKIAYYPTVLSHNYGEYYTIHKNISSSTYEKLFGNNCYSNSTQQRNGDCYLLSTINALMENPYGRNAIINCFSETPDGKVIVSLPNGKHSFDLDFIMKEVAKNPSQYSATGIGTQALEYVFGIERFDKLTTAQKAALALEGKDAIDYRNGGLSKEVMQMFGLNAKETNVAGMIKYLQDPNNWYDKNAVFTIATKKTPSGGGDDTFWYKDLDLAGNHMYLAQPRLQNGQVVVDIKNPWHSNKISCTLTLEQLQSLGCFDYFSITKVK